MSFDPQKFRTLQWEPQKAVLPVENAELRDALGVSEVEVRGLDGLELARMRQSGRSAETVGKLISDLATQQAGKGAAAQVLAVLGLDPAETPDDVVKQVFAVEHGCVEPKFERDIVIKLHQVQPAFIALLAQKILELSAEGQTLGKSPPSGKIAQFGQT